LGGFSRRRAKVRRGDLSRAGGGARQTSRNIAGASTGEIARLIFKGAGEFAVAWRSVVSAAEKPTGSRPATHSTLLDDCRLAFSDPRRNQLTSKA
jgi:hypothetical protein